MKSYVKLSTKLYRVTIPMVATYTEAEMDMLGVPIDNESGNPITDSFNKLTTVMLKLDRIIDIYTNGYPITINNDYDVINIYNELEQYLAGTKGRNVTSINQQPVIEKRFEEIDHFCNDIFQNNRHLIEQAATTHVQGFDLGIPKMEAISTTPTKYDNADVGQNKGVMEGYNNPTNSSQRHNGYINRQTPQIKRTPMYTPTFDNN